MTSIAVTAVLHLLPVYSYYMCHMVTTVGVSPRSLVKWYDTTFYLTSEASEFKRLCDEVHAFTDGVITERRELLVR